MSNKMEVKGYIDPKFEHIKDVRYKLLGKFLIKVKYTII